MWFKRRYDPYPDLVAAQRRVLAEITVQAKNGELSAKGFHAASRAVLDTFQSFTIYATVGRDRRKLGPEWAEQCEVRMRESVSFVQGFAAFRGD